MASIPENQSKQNSANNITEEYRILHKVAQLLQTTGELKKTLQDVLQAITGFEDLKVENKEGGGGEEEGKKGGRRGKKGGKGEPAFLENEKEIPFGD